MRLIHATSNSVVLNVVNIIRMALKLILRTYSTRSTEARTNYLNLIKLRLIWLRIDEPIVKVSGGIAKMIFHGERGV